VEVYNELYDGSLLTTGLGAHFEDSEKKQCQKKKNKKHDNWFKHVLFFGLQLVGKRKRIIKQKNMVMSFWAFIGGRNMQNQTNHLAGGFNPSEKY